MKIQLNKAVKYLNIQMQQPMNRKPNLNHKNKPMLSLIKMKILLLQTIHKQQFQKQMMEKRNNKLRMKKKIMRLIINLCQWLRTF